MIDQKRRRVRWDRLRGSALAHAFAAGLVLACAVSALAPSCASAREEPAPAPALDERLALRLDAIVASEVERQQLIGLSYAVARAGGTVHVAHFGWEDRDRAIPTSNETMYRLASISKPITAVVALQLANEKKLDLDRDVHAYVAEFPPQPHPITARQLLCHQGGIVHYSNGPVITTPARTDVAHPYEDNVDALATFAASPLVCEPGTKYSYSTHGYVLLGAVLQRAGGEPFEDLVEKRVTRPLGMVTLRPDKQWVTIPHRTIGYQKDKAEAVVPSDDGDVSWKLAGGGFISCVDDLARFGSGMLGERLVDHETRERMWTPQPTKDGAVTDYGLGFRIDTHAGKRLILHGGSQEKTRTRLLIVPEDDLVVVLMCNSEWADLAPVGKLLLDALVVTQ